MTPSVKALSHDRLYYFLPYWDEKPTVYIRSSFPDHRKRMYNSNAIGKIADKVVRTSGVVVVAQLVERSLPTLKICCWDKLGQFWLSRVCGFSFGD